MLWENSARTRTKMCVVFLIVCHHHIIISGKNDQHQYEQFFAAEKKNVVFCLSQQISITKSNFCVFQCNDLKVTAEQLPTPPENRARTEQRADECTHTNYNLLLLLIYTHNSTEQHDDSTRITFARTKNEACNS